LLSDKRININKAIFVCADEEMFTSENHQIKFITRILLGIALGLGLVGLDIYATY
jgi:hypothetical protein